MKLDVSTVITNIKGEPLKIGAVEVDKDGNKTDGPNLTFADILINAALTPSGNKTYKNEEHVQRFQLALSTERVRTTKSPIIEISAETAAFIKDDIGRIYAPLIAGQVLPWLDGK